jgi:hydroxycarboxylate dehydrogenase B
LTTFGEHKGYALAFVCEMLAGALCGSGTMRPERQGRGTATNGMLTIVIDPSRLVDREWLAQEIAAMTAYITASPPARPDEPVLIPGDPERRTRAERIANGIPIDDETWRELVAAARGINVLVEPPQSKPG